jgi:hypothetical protein
MNDLSKYTPTELLKMINDVKNNHEALKVEIIAHTADLDNIEIIINKKISELTNIEKQYINLIEELNNR